MAESITLTITTPAAGVTQHEFLVSVDGGAYQSLGFVAMPTVTRTYSAAAGDHDFKAISYVGDIPGGEVEITAVIIPTQIRRFTDAELSDAGDWTREAFTTSYYATGGESGTAKYTFNLDELSGWSSGEDVDVYVKCRDVTGNESPSTSVLIVVNSPAQPPLDAAADPAFNFPDGTITTADFITITSTLGVPIYYTIDGSTPTTGSTLYTEPFTLGDGLRIVKAIATGGGHSSSGVTTANYTVEVPAVGTLLAFPGAEGFGQFTTGGRGGTVYVVDTLVDSVNIGSFRHACLASGPRTIVFDVGGEIYLDVTLGSLVIDNGDLTIAGETAPGDGIGIYYWGLEIRAGNIIIRNIRVRREVCYEDSIRLRKGSNDVPQPTNVILDHVTVAWGGDGVMDIGGFNNVTVQRCIIGPSFCKTACPNPGGGCGMAITNTSDYLDGSVPVKVSLHHNLWPHNGVRMPYVQTSELDFVNNVLYNGKDGYTLLTPRNGFVAVNIVSNYYKKGPIGSVNAVRLAGIGPTDGAQEEWLPLSGVYLNGNVHTIYRPDATTGSDLDIVYDYRGGWPADQVHTDPADRYVYPLVTTTDAATAYTDVLSDVGCNAQGLDAYDAGIIAQVQAGTGSRPTKVGDVPGGYPTLATSSHDWEADYNTWAANYGNPVYSAVVHLTGWTAIECFIYGIPPNDY